MVRSRPRRWAASVALALVLGLVGCATTVPTPVPAAPTGSVSVPPTAIPASASAATGSLAPTADASGFAFAAADVVAYYESQGYACGAMTPSSKAAAFGVRTCRNVDESGRELVVGIVTDPSGALANGFGSVQGAPGETFLAPIDALDPLAGFLGAMLGEDGGTTLLPWLAGHLGDEYAETTSGPIRIATFTESADDRSKLHVELANRTYLDAPGTPAP